MVLKCKNDNDKKSTLQDYLKHCRIVRSPIRVMQIYTLVFWFRDFFLFFIRDILFFFAIFFSWHLTCRVFHSRLFLSTVSIAARSETQSIAENSRDIVVHTWLDIALNGYTWLYMAINGCTQVYKAIQGYTWLFFLLYGETNSTKAKGGNRDVIEQYDTHKGNIRKIRHSGPG